MAAIICQNICKPCTAICNSTFENPFCLFVSTSTVLNIIPMTLSFNLLIRHISEQNHDNNKDNDYSNHCQGMITHLSINTCLCMTNIIAAWYLANQVLVKQQKQQQYQQSSVTSPSFKQTIFLREHFKDSAFRRTMYLLCYDVGIALYIPFLIWFYYWQWKGFFLLLRKNDQHYCDNEMIRHAFTSSLSFGWCYVILGTCTFCFSSLCCSPFYHYREEDEFEQVGGIESAANRNRGDTAPMVAFSSTTEEPLVLSTESNTHSNIPIAVATPIIPCPNESDQQKNIIDSSRVTSLPPVLPCPSFLSGSRNNYDDNIQHPPPITMEQMKKADIV